MRHFIRLMSKCVLLSLGELLLLAAPTTYSFAAYTAGHNSHIVCFPLPILFPMVGIRKHVVVGTAAPVLSPPLGYKPMTANI